MELLYARYNRHRLPAFQVETSIWRDQDWKFVLKKALVPAAIPHLQHLHQQAAVIRRSLRGGRLRLPAVEVLDGQTLRFEFVEGRGLDDVLTSAFMKRDQTAFLDVITGFRELIAGAFATTPSPVLTESMREVFGLASKEELDGLGPFLTPALVDPLFDNILVDGDRHYLIDHEWVFEGCLPVSFVLYRSLFYFYEKNKVFGLETWLPLAAVWERVALAPRTIRRYQEMEEAFQAHVFGRERCFRYKDRYAKHALSVPSLMENVENQGRMLRDYYGEIERLRGEVADLRRENERLGKMLGDYYAEIERLRGEVADLRRENERQSRLIETMRNSRGWKFVQTVGRLMDTWFPLGTRRRRILERMLRRLLFFL